MKGKDYKSLSNSKKRKIFESVHKEDPGLSKRKSREIRNEARKGTPLLAGHATPNVYTAETGASYGHPKAFHEMKKIREAPGNYHSPIDAAAYAKMKQMGMTPWRPLSDSPRVEKGLRKAVAGASKKQIDNAVTQRLEDRREDQEDRARMKKSKIRPWMDSPVKKTTVMDLQPKRQ